MFANFCYVLQVFQLLFSSNFSCFHHIQFMPLRIYVLNSCSEFMFRIPILTLSGKLCWGSRTLNLLCLQFMMVDIRIVLSQVFDVLILLSVLGPYYLGLNLGLKLAYVMLWISGLGKTKLLISCATKLDCCIKVW